MAAHSTIEDEDSFVYIFDRRTGDAPEMKIKTGGLFSFTEFKDRVREYLEIRPSESFVIATTNRDEISDDGSWDLVDNGDTLYALKDIKQELSAPAEERVNYLPHYDTIVKGGMYEYYASEGQNPISFAFAELIDNALAATSTNLGERLIELRMHFDDSNPMRNMIIIKDNGKGMTPRQLNNWAVYRLSKFNRRERRSKGNVSIVDEDVSIQIPDPDAPRSLNSDISFFGVGGKQAIFYIGSATRMITKSQDSKDVHELTISKEDFEKRERNHESIYSGIMLNRKPGDCSHLPVDDDVLKKLISEEANMSSFTAVVIHGINTDHIAYLKQNMNACTRELAHIYHYYLHGPQGNVRSEEVAVRVPSPFKHISIEVKIFNRGQTHPKLISLRDIEDDVQTQFVQSAASIFEFKATVEGTGVVEGELRYHPFLYDRETYPVFETQDHRSDSEPFDDHDYAISDRPARGRKSIFECYWNGRLIPYTFVDELDWCAAPKKIKDLPLDCYNRMSGVLWTNDKFQVSTNKLTFLDLEMRLRDKNTVVNRIVGGQERRTAIDKELVNWLKECHDQHDKQICFSANKGVITRAEMPKNRQTPWTMFEQIEWDTKVYKKGQLIRVSRTAPAVFGTIQYFYLFGQYGSSVFATGGDMVITQEPTSLYDETKIFPLARLDRTASPALVKKYLEDEEAKLPDRLIVAFPNGSEVQAGEKRLAGKTIGDVKVEIANKKGELISKLPGTAASSKKLLVELKIIWHAPSGDEVIVSHICQHGKSWPYWFRKMENIKNLGSHTLKLQVVLNESGVSKFAGKELPTLKIPFTITEAEAQKFTVGVMDGPFRVGTAFQIPLDFQDEYNHPTKPSKDIKPTLEASGLKLSYESTHVKNNSLIIKGIIAKGPVTSGAGKSYSLTVKVAGLRDESLILKIRLLPGLPDRLEVMPEDESIAIENGTALKYEVTVLDAVGNVTTENKLYVICKFSGASGLPTYTTDCSLHGHGTLTGDVITLKKVTENTVLTARIEIQGYKNVPAIEKKVHVIPSYRPADIQVRYLKNGSSVLIKSGEDIEEICGGTVQGLEYVIFDEGGQKMEVMEKHVGQIKVNWLPRVPKETLLNGKLPDIKVPSSVTDSKFCQIILTDGSNIEFDFTIKPIAGEASQVKCKLSRSGAMTHNLGEKLASEILLLLKDKHGNDVDVSQLGKDGLKEVTVEGQDVNIKHMSVITTKGKPSAYSISGVHVEGGMVGTREICVRWRELKDYLRLEVQAGFPTKLSLPGWDLEQPVIVYTEAALPKPLLIQLCDDHDNDCHVADVKIQIARDNGIKLTPALQPTKSNYQGVVNFGRPVVTAQSGLYELQPKAFLTGSKALISGPKLRVSVMPDPSRPSRIDVKYDSKATHHAGGKMCEFRLQLIAEDGSVLKTAQSSALTMKLWKTDSQHQAAKPPPKALSFSPSPRAKGDESGIYYFRNHKLPVIAGQYHALFVYYDGSLELFGEMVSLDILSGASSKLVPSAVPGTPTVSNTRSIASRTLVRSLELELQDDYGNASGKHISGRLVVVIVGEKELPVFAGNTLKLELPFSKGRAYMQNLVLQENSPGRDGAEYKLKCDILTNSIPNEEKLPSYEIPFLFYNDARKQTQMAALSKERDSLQNALKHYKSMFETSEQLVEELKNSVQRARQEEQRLKADLKKFNVSGPSLNSLESVDQIIQNRIQERMALRDMPKRRCALPQINSDPEILGKIGHSALIEEQDIARVLSWHMSADMDCVVTYTSNKAKEIYRETNGRQQVLPLDSVYRKNLPDWSKPLPHVKFKPNWRPPGRPEYARNLLGFTQNEEHWRIVFGMLLGDTLILDNLDHANSYRHEIIRYTHCPTILTRTGDRIRSNGKFGGVMNKALPIEKLRGAVFGEPLPQAFHSMSSQIECLEHFRAALDRRVRNEDDLKEQMECVRTSEMRDKYREYTETDVQLKDIETKMFGICQSPMLSSNSAAITSVMNNCTRLPAHSPIKPLSFDLSSYGDSSPIPSKKPRLSPRTGGSSTALAHTAAPRAGSSSTTLSHTAAASPQVNHQRAQQNSYHTPIANGASPMFAEPSPVITPTRTSARIASDSRRRSRHTPQ